MGVKEVLYRTRHLGWGADTHLDRTERAFRAEFPARPQSAGPRVLKQNRGMPARGCGTSSAITEAGDAGDGSRVEAAAGACPKR